MVHVLLPVIHDESIFARLPKSGSADQENDTCLLDRRGKSNKAVSGDVFFTCISQIRGLSFSSRPSNKEERIFLEQEYDGHCQICLKQIRKYNGEHYFEAINIIKFSKLPERLANSGKYGWNSFGKTRSYNHK